MKQRIRKIIKENKREDPALDNQTLAIVSQIKAKDLLHRYDLDRLTKTMDSKIKKLLNLKNTVLQKKTIVAKPTVDIRLSKLIAITTVSITWFRRSRSLSFRVIYREVISNEFLRNH